MGLIGSIDHRIRVSEPAEQIDWTKSIECKHRLDGSIGRMRSIEGIDWVILIDGLIR